MSRSFLPSLTLLSKSLYAVSFAMACHLRNAASSMSTTLAPAFWNTIASSLSSACAASFANCSSDAPTSTMTFCWSGVSLLHVSFEMTSGSNMNQIALLRADVTAFEFSASLKLMCEVDDVSAPSSTPLDIAL